MSDKSLALSALVRAAKAEHWDCCAGEYMRMAAQTMGPCRLPERHRMHQEVGVHPNDHLYIPGACVCGKPNCEWRAALADLERAE